MAEEEKDGGAPEGATPLEQIVDKPRLSEPSGKDAIIDAPRRSEPSRAKREPKPDKPAIPEGYVPLREVLDTRDRMRKAEEERDRYRAYVEDQQRKLADAEDNDPAPDMFKNPTAYSEWLDRRVNKRAEHLAKQQVEPLTAKLSDYAIGMSEMRAKSVLGDKFGPFNEWLLKQSDEFKDRCMQTDDPYAVAFQQYRTRTTFERLGDDDLDSFVEKEVKRRLAEAQGPIDPDDDGFADERAAPAAKQNAPRSFAGARNAEPKDPAQKWAGPKPLGQLVGQPKQHKR